MTEDNIMSVDGPCCPLCFKQFNRPRQLPCVHSFCEKCLQSQIENIKDMNPSHVKCPVCGNSTSYTIKDRPISEWASTFPVNTILPSVKDRLCEACRGIYVQAEEYCAGCQEVMGLDLRVQKKLKTSRDRGMEELFCNPENVTKFVEGFTCTEHDGSDIKYYCKDHKVLCCGTCTIQTHKICSIMLIFGEEFARMLQECKPYEMISCLELIENDLTECMEMNKSSVKNLEIQTKTVNVNIGEARKKLSAVLDKLEVQLTIEVNRIYKEEIDKKLDNNHKCSTHIHALRNSQYLLKAVDKHGSNLQKFLTMVKMKSQLHVNHNQKIEECKKAGKKVEITLSSSIQSILSDSLSELGKIVTLDRLNVHPPTCLKSLKKCCLLENGYVMQLKGSREWQPNYTGATFLHGDRLMIADFNNKKCILLNSTYNIIASHTLPGNPWNVCALSDQEVAVSTIISTEIQILSVLGDVIRPIKTIITSFSCNGMAASGKGEMVVNSFCIGQSSSWSVYLRYEAGIYCTYNSSHLNYIGLNNNFTHVYIALTDTNSLLCFDMYGRKLFTYNNAYLKGPRGVAVDRYDNIYVVGFHSCNIHQLSPLGSLLQIITEGIPRAPCAICIDQHRDMLVLTTRNTLHIYQLKQYIIGN